MGVTIVLLSGKQGAGKSTLASGLVTRLNAKKDWEAIELKFASALYQMHDECLRIMRYFGIDVPEKDGSLLQLLGTDWGRKKYGDNVWVNVMRGNIKETVKSRNWGGGAENLLIVISDCRFKNEFDEFPEALRVRLSCDEQKRKIRAEKWRDHTEHPSEIDLDYYANAGKFDLYLDTDSTSIQGCLELVMAKLDKGGWIERRGISG